jgi:putative ABC transport system permease protein
VVGVVEEIGAAGVVYVTRAAFAATSSGAASRMLRVVTTANTPEQRAAIVRDIDDRLRDAGADLELVTPFAELRTAVGGHVTILVQLLVAAAAVLAVVGLMGLASAMGTAVVERTREIAITKALGATRRWIRRTIVGEAILLAAISWLVAVLASLPLTWSIDVLVGRLGFLAPLPFVISVPAMVGWAIAVLVGATLAAAIPARRAAEMTVHQALGET